MPHAISDDLLFTKEKPWHEMKFHEMVNCWFDRLVESNDPAKAEMLVISRKWAIHKNVRKMRAAANKLADVRLRNDICCQLDVLPMFKREFRFVYAFYPKWLGQCSAADSLFSSIYQAITYND